MGVAHVRSEALSTLAYKDVVFMNVMLLIW